MDMRTSKFSEEQIIGFLRQAEEGMPIKEIGRKPGRSMEPFQNIFLFSFLNTFLGCFSRRLTHWAINWCASTSMQ
jgi:hypothetical protein